MNDPYVYDKAEYHADSIEEYSLPESHASHHVLVILRWLLDNDLMSEEFYSDCPNIDKAHLNKEKLLELYASWDYCLIDNMVSDKGNEFGKAYFDLQRGRFITDYIKALKGSLPTELHIDFNENNYLKIREIINKRHEKWLQPKKWWWPF